MVVNVNDTPRFRSNMNNFMRDFDDMFDLEFRQESILYSPALGRNKVDEEGNNVHKFGNTMGKWDYPSGGKPDAVGKFRDKSKSIARDNNGKKVGHYYTKTRRNNSPSFAFAKNGDFEREEWFNSFKEQNYD